MADHVSVTSHHSYGSRVGNSFKNIFRWIILVIISIILLVRNENNYVKQKAALNEWASVVQEASATQVDSSLEGKEVHVNWETASNAEALQDNVFWIVTDDLKLKRTVEMYQWYEESSEHCSDNVWWSEDCTTTYDYYKKWSSEKINSNNFYESNWHSNPSSRAYDSTEQTKSPITLWAYTLTQTFTEKLSDYEPINLAEQNIKVPDQYQRNTANSVEENNDNYLYWEINDSFHILNDYIYIWKDTNSPAIWDLRISFSSVKPSTVSIVGKQLWNELTSYTVSNGRIIALLEQWSVTAEDMFQHAQQANRQMTWILRFFGLLLMFCGFSMMMKFMETIAKVLPFLANIIWVWTGIIALCLTIVVWFVVIGLAWIAVRPVVWIACLIVAVAGIFLLSKSKKNKKADTPITPDTNNPETAQPTPEVPQA